MRNLYLIAYDEKIKRDELTSFLSEIPKCGPWFYSLPNAVFVFSPHTAAELYDRIKARFPSHGRFFVTVVPYHDSLGWMPKNHWELIERNRAVHDYSLEFSGYWLDENRDRLPAESGVYCVYAATCDRAARSVKLDDVLYIGKSVNVRERHANHEGRPGWLAELARRDRGEVLCYSFAPLAERSLSICEAALIFRCKPVCNDQGKTEFLHGATHVITHGRNALLETEFTVFHR